MYKFSRSADADGCHLLFLLFLVLVTHGSSLQLSPADVRINEAGSAVFNCTFECSIRDSHTIVWLVGDLPFIQRYFVMGRTRTFSSQSDLQVQVSDLSTCTSAGEGRGVQQLQIQVTSATLHNRTAVQCHAARKHTDYSDLYSMYGLVLVDHNIDSSSTDATVSIPSPTPTTSTSQICPTQIQVMTVIKEVTVTSTLVMLPSTIPTLDMEVKLPHQTNSSASSTKYSSCSFISLVVLYLSLKLIG